MYLTDIPPLATDRRRLSTVFGRRRFYAERLQAYVRIDRDKADAQPRGRERVDALLKSIEHGEATLPPGERFDVSSLRRSLGL